MTALRDSLIRQIAAQGPITVAEYMTTCLLHPQHGYYTTRDPFGTQGDFTTAPEISQMFGEILGLCIAQVWMDQGRPAPFTLAELGPGRGTLMADLLRATRAVPRFNDAARLHLVEASPVLRRMQARNLPDAQFHDSADTLPDAPLFIIANEFFDALPIRQFLRAGNGWRERMVGLRDGKLAFGLGPVTALAALEHRLADMAEGQMVETCAPAAHVLAAMATQIDKHGGCALIIDYGDWRSRGDTFQALYQHAHDDPLAHPGQADLTAHVDFEALAQAAAPLHATDLTPQGVFLERLGITQRAQTLARSLDGAALQAHIAAHRRLTHPQEMGHLFKVLGLHPQTTPVPPGFGS
ncbi:class I SAM-dependent methyltransferase [Roseinatronobacter alkalisoli]|uniref:SAM-dependent methyltransferase n=1 Tax=Roseinatronobacter alkalisoli TaxID=3028235 RepID=A0ABT5T955_9RHOB|nr:SAM-dependent methyltransferase [Roseinatronobacter sp. HJB301]MDD7971653.1 SAM-dependent methyltransferase [Roseinatronobacter sp. HJB301]